MRKKINKDRFQEIKKFLNTPILVKPSISYVADVFGYSSGTISAINKYDNYESYKTRQAKDCLASEIAMVSKERAAAIKEFQKFNDEWFFHDAPQAEDESGEKGRLR